MSGDKHKVLSRVYFINNILLQTVKSIYRLRKVGMNASDGKSIYAYTISLAKNYPNTLEEQVTSFYNACKRLLNDNEKLLTENKCFKIVSDNFEIYYCIEAWRKSADKIAYIEGGEVKVDLLHRMSCEQAAYIFKKYSIEPFEFINTLELLKKYDNPADKYAVLAKFPLLCTGEQADADSK